jgi:HD-GYP domain-containing protein (c-di-GMP phosphodiesterase class II)
MSMLKRAKEFGLSQNPSANRRPEKDVNELLATIENMYQIKDLDSLLESILFEARRFVSADAGTIYLAAGGRLYFSYVQNDTLIPAGSNSEKYLGGSASLVVDKNSIAGYVALTGESLLIDDVYDIRSPVVYSFNPEFDRKSSYKTRSILVVPLATREGSILGVLQLINAKDARNAVVPFSMRDRLYISHFAQSAANAIEKAKLSREMVLRLVEMAELRDPYETGPHVKRVGAYSVELYDAWARLHAVSVRETAEMKDVLRTAAILHDLGKVAVSDAILKKPGSLTADERTLIKMHTVYGARLFLRSNSAWDTVAGDVTLNHHECWNGSGYPGKIRHIGSTTIEFGPGKREAEIPLSARIVAIADTYDALISKRSYKEAWDTGTAFKYLAAKSGSLYDPELVRIFMGIAATVEAIRGKYVENKGQEDPVDLVADIEKKPSVAFF